MEKVMNFLVLELGSRNEVEGLGLVCVGGDVKKNFKKKFKEEKEKFIEEEGKEGREYIKEYWDLVEGKDNEYYRLVMGEEYEKVYINLNVIMSMLERMW